MFSMSRALLTAMCLALVLGSTSLAFAQTAGSGIDTNQSTLPFSIGGKTLMTLQGGSAGTGLAFPYNTTVSSAGVMNLQSGSGTAIYIAATPYLSVNKDNTGAGVIGISGGVTINGAGAALSVTGNITSTTELTIGNASLQQADIATINNLQKVGVCNTGSTGTTASALAVTGSSGGVLSFACETIADITGVGTTTLPTCTSTQALNFDGTKFVCVANPTVPKCDTGQVLTANGTVYSCVANPPLPSCPSGSVYQGMSGNTPVCSQAMPNCAKNQLVGTDASGNPACLNAPPPNANGSALYIKSTPWVTDYTEYNKVLWAGLGGGTTAQSAANLAKMSTAYQQWWGACKITGNNDTTINDKASSTLCTSIYCTGVFGAAPLMSQSGGVCNSTQAESGINCTAPTAANPTGTMFYTNNCLYAGAS